MKVSQILLVLKLFANNKTRINEFIANLSGGAEAAKKKKFVEEKKALIADDYRITPDDKKWLDEVLNETVIDDFLSKI